MWPPNGANRAEPGQAGGLPPDPGRPAGSPYPDAVARAGYEPAGGYDPAAGNGAHPAGQFGRPQGGASHGVGTHGVGTHGPDGREGDAADVGGQHNGAYGAAAAAYSPYENGAYRAAAYDEGSYDRVPYDAGAYAAGGYGGTAYADFGAPGGGNGASGYARGPDPAYEAAQEARGYDRGHEAPGYSTGFDVGGPTGGPSGGQGQPAAPGGYVEPLAARQSYGHEQYSPNARLTAPAPAEPARSPAPGSAPTTSRAATPGLATTPPPPPLYPPGEFAPFGGPATPPPGAAPPLPPPPPPTAPPSAPPAGAGGQPGQPSATSHGGPALAGTPAGTAGSGPVGAALPTSAAVAETLFSQAPVALAFHDASGRYVRVNDVLARLNGRPVADHIGRTPPELLGEIGHELATLLGRALRTGEPVGDLEMSVATGGAGPTQTWQASWYPVAGPGGAPLGAVFVAIDVSGRREAEQEAARERERLRLLAEAVASDVLRAGSDGAFDGDMPRWRAATGQRRVQSDGLGWLDSVHPGDRDTVRRAWQGAVDRGESFEAEFRVLGADGAERVMTARALAAAGGGEWVGALTDITELRTAQAASETASGRVRAATDRVEQIQRVTAALAKAVTSDDVVAVVMDAGRALGAVGRGVALIDDSREQLTFRALQGYSAEYTARWSAIGLGAVHPAAEVVRGRRPLFLASREELTTRWPVPDLVEAVGASEDRAWALLPLGAGDAPTGVLMFGFPAARDFSLDERGYLELLADQCALAFERAALFEGALAQAAAGRVAQEQTAAARADAERAGRRLGVVAAVTAAMNAAAVVADPAAPAAPTSPDRALRALAEAAVGEIADVCAIYLLTQPAPAAGGAADTPGELAAESAGPAELDAASAGPAADGSPASGAGTRDAADSAGTPALLRVAAATAPGIASPPRARPVRWPAASTVAQAFTAAEPRLGVPRGALRAPVAALAAGTAGDAAEERPTGALPASATDEVRWAPRAGAHTVAAAPIVRQGRPVGVVLVAAVGDRPALTEQDLPLLGELAGRAAEALDRAELAAAAAPRALAAARRSAPRRALRPAGIAVAARYQAGEGQTSWDWYEVVDLGAGRAGLVIGNIAASGEVAAAAMEALRASVRACARLDLPPHEAITLLDGVLADLADERQAGQQGTDARPDTGTVAPAGAVTTPDDGVSGQLATCIYAIVEADSGRVTLASAGHPPPLVVAPDGLVSRLYMEVGPPLGARRDDVKEYVVRLGPDWLLALFTDGVVAAGGREPDAGVSQLAGALARPGAPLAELADDALALIGPAGSGDPAGGGTDGGSAGLALTADAALLLARLPAAPPPGTTVELTVEGGAADLAPARAAARAALADWSLPAEALETAVLVLSELVGNAVAHGRPPIDARVRRLADRVVVEVADSGGRLPRRRHAGVDQEAGRGLELVATLADRWGVRPTADGKVVWAEIGPAALTPPPTR